MKILVQHTLRNPQDWTEIDSSQWVGLPKKVEPRVGRPQGDSGINNIPGWIYDLNVQGIHFGGADHYAVEDLPGGAVLVTAWYDDPEDYPEGKKYARVSTLEPLAPDRNLGGAINTKQSSIVYAEPLAATRIGGTILPWTDFVPPPKSITRHGIWISDILSDAHIAARTLKGWRNWGEYLDLSELDADGRVKVQRDLGRWNKAKGTITYFQRDTNRAVGYAAYTQENALETTTATSGSETTTVSQNSSDVPKWSFVTPSNEPNVADWPNGTYRVQFDVTAVGGNIVYYCKDLTNNIGFARAGSALVAIEEQVSQAEDDFLGSDGTGLKLATVSWNPAAGNSSDRFAVHLGADNNSAHMDEDITLELNTSDSFADGPWAAAAPPTINLVMAPYTPA